MQPNIQEMQAEARSLRSSKDPADQHRRTALLREIEILTGSSFATTASDPFPLTARERRPMINPYASRR